jgi:hypothetical protein
MNIIQEVRRLDIAMQNLMLMHGGKGGEQRAEIHLHIRHGEVAEVLAEVDMTKVGQHGDNLV